MVAEPAVAMATMVAQLTALDAKLGTFESAVNGRIATLEEITSKFAEKLVAMGDAMDMAGLHGNAIQELQEAERAEAGAAEAVNAEAGAATDTADAVAEARAVRTGGGQPADGVVISRTVSVPRDDVQARRRRVGKRQGRQQGLRQREPARAPGPQAKEAVQEAEPEEEEAGNEDDQEEIAGLRR